MYKKLLVAYDGSDSAKNALLQSFNLAQKERSWIKVVAVVPSYEGDIDLTGVGDIEAIVKGPAEKLVAEARAIAAEQKVSILTDIEQGEAYEKIIEVAEEELCDLIVMGRRGQRNIGQMIMGSVTARVIAHSSKDVLVIPRDAALGWGSIMVCADGSKGGAIAASKAIALAREHGCEVTIVSVVNANPELYAEAPKLVERLIENAKGMVETVRAQAETAGVKISTYIKEGEPYYEITELARTIGTDMIVIGSHGRLGISKLLMGSVAEKVIGTAHCPVLVSKAV